MTEFKPLPREFFLPSAALVAARLVGHWLLRQGPDGVSGGVIVETEAYLHDDPACHASRGRTERNAAMFGPPGRAYVYFIYGCHFCLNAVCHAEGVPEAVLIRAVEPVFGIELTRRRRPGIARLEQLANGPGKLCAAFDIGRNLNHTELGAPGGPLLMAENPAWRELRRRSGPVVRGPRIGISKWLEAPLRFHLARSPFVSKGSYQARASRA